MVRSFTKLVSALGERTGWEKAIFLLAPLPALQGRRPLDMLIAGPTPQALSHLEDLARHDGEMGR